MHVFYFCFLHHFLPTTIVAIGRLPPNFQNDSQSRPPGAWAVASGSSSGDLRRQLDNVDKSLKIQDVAKGCGGSRTHTPQKFNIASKKGNLFLKGNSSSHLQFSGSMLNFRGV